MLSCHIGHARQIGHTANTAQTGQMGKLARLRSLAILASLANLAVRGQSLSIPSFSPFVTIWGGQFQLPPFPPFPTISGFFQDNASSSTQPTYQIKTFCGHQDECIGYYKNHFVGYQGPKLRLAT